MKSNVSKLTLTAMLFAMAMVLSIVEGMIPVPIPVPGVKYGLSNIVVMYCMLLLGNRFAVGLVLLKGTFACVGRGLIAGSLSLTGGLLSLLMMMLVKKITKGNCSYILLSITGALCHNIGQMAAIVVIYANRYILAYFPILLISGLIMGILTAILLKYLMPAFSKFSWIINQKQYE